MKKQPKTEKNPRGAGLPPPPKDSKTFQMRSVPIFLHKEIRNYIKGLINEKNNMESL